MTFSHPEGHCDDHHERSHRWEGDVPPRPYIASWRPNSHRHATSRPHAVQEARVHPRWYGRMELLVIYDADDDDMCRLNLYTFCSDETLWCPRSLPNLRNTTLLVCVWWPAYLWLINLRTVCCIYLLTLSFSVFSSIFCCIYMIVHPLHEHASLTGT